VVTQPDDRPGPARGIGGAAIWAFDVDGCLVDSMTGTSLRPGALEALSLLRADGATVLLWSAGGRKHAMSRASELGFAHLIDSVYAKEVRGADGRWSTANLPPEHQPDVFVDDWPDEAPATARLVAVPPYIAPNPHDRGLAPLLAELSGALSTRPTAPTYAAVPRARGACR
jgi:long-chain acyl-CoA synthetase